MKPRDQVSDVIRYFITPLAVITLIPALTPMYLQRACIWQLAFFILPNAILWLSLSIALDLIHGGATLFILLRACCQPESPG